RSAREPECCDDTPAVGPGTPAAPAALRIDRSDAFDFGVLYCSQDTDLNSLSGQLRRETEPCAPWTRVKTTTASGLDLRLSELGCRLMASGFALPRTGQAGNRLRRVRPPSYPARPRPSAGAPT